MPEVNNPLDELLQVQNELEQARPKKRQHPEGWEPGVVWDGSEGTVTTTGMPAENAPDWSTVLKVWGLEPENFEVVEPVLFNVWGDTLGVLNRQWKGKVVRKNKTNGAEVEELISEIKKHKPKKAELADGDSALIVALSDLQIGKGEGGGTAATVQRFLAGISEVETRWKELTRAGRKLDRLIVVGLGDVVEGCSGFYDMQEFQTDLDRREQTTVARRLIVKALTHWATFAPLVIVAAIPGNHGENRKGGKAYTTFGDNDDVAVFEQVAEIIGANEAYSHVKFVFPKNELTLILNIHGTVIGLAHGHQARGGGNASGKVGTWWAKQALGMAPVADATLLLTGHYHHLSVTEHGARTHIQAPSLDGGSQWFAETSGASARSGLLTLVVGETGWDDLKVLRCEF